MQAYKATTSNLLKCSFWFVLFVFFKKKEALKVQEKLPEIAPLKSAAVTSNSSTSQLNGKRKIAILSDDDESENQQND